jgi:CubicO group peptidase (beta-lactamase class C family)
MADAQVTFRDLLSHRTGVPDDLGGGWFERYGTRENLIRAAMARPAVGPFRRVFNYNNMFLAVGEAVAAANHLTYEEVIQRDLLDPLGMRESGMTLGAMEASNDFALGYEDSARTAVKPTRLYYNVAIAPAANINSTASDMGQWLRMLTSGGLIGGKRIVSDSGLRSAAHSRDHDSVRRTLRAWLVRGVVARDDAVLASGRREWVRHQMRVSPRAAP